MSKKIAIITPWFMNENSIGGTERYVSDLAYGLKNKGWIVDVFMLSGENYIKDKINFISLNLWGENVIGDEYSLKDKFGTLDNEKSYDKIAEYFDSIIDFSEYDVLQLNSHLFLKCWVNKKRIFTVHSNEKEFIINNSPEEFNLMKKIMKQQAKGNTLFIIPSNSYFTKWEKILKRNVICIPHSINISRLKCGMDKSKILNKYRLKNNKVNILIPNRLEPIQKRPLYFLKGYSKLNEDQRKNHQIILSGMDSQYEKYVKDIKLYCYKNKINIKFVKFDNINEGYKIADLVALPNKSESFGYSALESLCLGKTTILSNIPTFREIGSNISNAYFFNNINSIYEILINVFKYNLFNEVNSSELIKRYEYTSWINRYNDVLIKAISR